MEGARQRPQDAPQIALTVQAKRVAVTIRRTGFEDAIRGKADDVVATRHPQHEIREREGEDGAIGDERLARLAQRAREGLKQDHALFAVDVSQAQKAQEGRRPERQLHRLDVNLDL